MSAVRVPAWRGPPRVPACLECGHFGTPQVDMLVELGLLAYDEEGRGTYDEAARYSTGLPWRFRDEVD